MRAIAAVAAGGAVLAAIFLTWPGIDLWVSGLFFVRPTGFVMSTHPFALFVNDVPLPPGVTTTREGKALGRICEIVHQHGP